MKDQKKRAVKTRPFGREDCILAEKCAKCVIFKEKKGAATDTASNLRKSLQQTARVGMFWLAQHLFGSP